MLSMRRHDQEKPLEADVLQVRLPEVLAPGLRAFRDADVISSDDLLVDRPWVLAFRNRARDVKEIAVGNVGDRHLLDESRNGCRFAPILHYFPGEMLFPRAAKERRCLRHISHKPLIPSLAQR